MLSHLTLKMPPAKNAAHKVLAHLRAKPGTFWQVCERAGLEFEVETRTETVLRSLFDTLVDSGHITKAGAVYSISLLARTMMERTDNAAYQGQVAGAAHRPIQAMPVTITTRRAV